MMKWSALVSILYSLFWLLEAGIYGFVLASWKLKILWSIGCLLMYSNMYSIGIKIPTWNEGHLQLFDDLWENVLKLSLWQIQCLQYEKNGLNHIL